MYSTNANAALDNHRAYFATATVVKYQSSKHADWETLENVVVHREEIVWVTARTGKQKLYKRSIFIDDGSVANRIGALIKIDSCVYTILAVIPTAARVELRLERRDIVEVTRPDYRR